MARLAVSAIFMLQLVLAVSDEGPYTYTVVGPGTIHSERKYNVAVTAHHNDVPSSITVGIEGTSYNEKKTLELQPNETKVVEFNVPYLEEGFYNLFTEGIVGMPFKDQAELNMKNFKPTIVIQTDKAQYKPGDNVNYRLIFLDENLKPAKAHKDTALWFEDPKYNQIGTIRNLTAVKGVYTGKFQIPTMAVLGTWSITARVENEFLYNGGDSVKFSVVKYVLPVYKVEVEMTDAVTVKDGDVQVVVRASYSYPNSQAINAKATVYLKVDTDYQRFYQKDKFGVPPVLSKTAVMLDGRAKFDFNAREWESYLPDKRISYVMIATASVEEDYTGLKINGTSRGSCYAYRYKMHCVGGNSCNNFYAEEEFDVPFEIRYYDGNLLQDNQSVVRLVYKEKITQTFPNGNYRNIRYENITAPVSPNRTFVFESYLNASSIAVFKVKLPDLEQFEYFDHYFEVDVIYKDEQERQWKTKQQWESETLMRRKRELKEWFYVRIKDTEEGREKPKVKLGAEASITIGSSLPLPYFVYNIIARGNVLSSVRVDLPDKPKTYEFKILTTFPMATYSNIYVYYIDEVGDFHYAESHFYVSLEFQNPIEISTQKLVRPGQAIDLHIKTTPNSFVGLLAVDQSVLLLGSNNDYSPDRFIGSLSRFITRSFGRGGEKCFPGSLSGVVTLTNANYFCSKSKPDYETVPATAVQAVVTKLSSPVEKHDVPPDIEYTAVEDDFDVSNICIRSDFSETWIFDNIENTETEEFTWTKKIPDTISSWIVTAFSLHAEKGLGITQIQTQANISTFRPFFIAVRLPYSVKRDQIISVPALVFNYLDKDVDVVVTLHNTDDEFEFIAASSKIIREPKQLQNVRVPAQDAVGVSFMIRPKIVGSVMLKFTAVSPVAGDTIHKTLKVEPSGVRQYDNRAYFAGFDKQPMINQTFQTEVTSKAPPDSNREALPGSLKKALSDEKIKALLDSKKEALPDAKKEAFPDAKEQSVRNSKTTALSDAKPEVLPDSKTKAHPDSKTKASPDNPAYFVSFDKQPMMNQTFQSEVTTEVLPDSKTHPDSKTKASPDNSAYFVSFDKQPMINQTFQSEVTAEALPNSKTPRDSNMKALLGSKKKALPDEKTKGLLDSKKEALPDAKTNALPAAKSKALPDFKTKALPEAKMEAMPVGKTVPLPDSKTQAVPHSKTKALPASNTKALPDSKAKSTLVSKHFTFSVVGDVLGPLIQDLDGLIRLPKRTDERTVAHNNPKLRTWR